MKLRVKEVAKSKGMSLQELSKRLNISYQALDARTRKNCSLGIIQGMADVLECHALELIEAPKGYGHFYVDGVWEGIRKV